MTLFATTDRPPSLKDIPALPETPESLYQANLIELHECKRQIEDVDFRIREFCEAHPQRSRQHFQRGEMFARVNALRDLHPRLAALESEKRRLEWRMNNEIQPEHARLKRATGRMK
jgi:hypothetical protein